MPKLKKHFISVVVCSVLFVLLSNYRNQSCALRQGTKKNFVLGSGNGSWAAESINAIKKESYGTRKNHKDENDDRTKSDKYKANDKSYSLLKKTNVFKSPWRSMPDPSQWCGDTQPPKPLNSINNKKNYPLQGIIYVKVHKTASSTTAGIALRLAATTGKRFNIRSEGSHVGGCNVQFNHYTNVQKRYSQRRVYERSYMWSMVRHPVKRVVSDFFHRSVTRRNNGPTDENFFSFLDKGFLNGKGAILPGKGGYQLQYLTPNVAVTKTRHLWPNDTDRVESAVQEVIQAYDFIGVTDRLDESIVALQLLMGSQTGDMLHLSAKASGGFAEPECRRIPISVISEGMKAYFNSSDWHERTVGDWALYRAVEAKLDATIEFLGRERFEQALKDYRRWQAVVDEKCKESTVFPCQNGTYHMKESKSYCYYRDSGCGYPCIDQLVQQMRINGEEGK